MIITSSVVGLTSAAGICAYVTAKHALVGLMRTLAKEMAPRGIRVNTIHPGPVDNEFQHRIEIAVTGTAPHLSSQTSRSTHASPRAHPAALPDPGSTTAMSHRGGPDHGDVTLPWTGPRLAGAVVSRVAGLAYLGVGGARRGVHVSHCPHSVWGLGHPTPAYRGWGAPTPDEARSGMERL